MKRRMAWMTATAALAIGAALVLSGPGFAKGGGGGGGGGGKGGGGGGGNTAPKNDKKTVLDEIEGDANLSKFTAALKASGVDATLKGTGPYTVLAPNDAAIGKIDAKWTELGKDKAKLKAAVEAHIVSGKMTAADIGKATKLTAGASSWEVKLGDDKQPTINGGAKIVKSDVQGSNGYVQIIDTVLMPPDKK